MGNTLYLECYTGISGDMTVAALLDLGANRDVLDAALKSLPVKGFEPKISRVKKAGLDACDFCVKLDSAHENHDHDMNYLYGHTRPVHGQEAEHSHGGGDVPFVSGKEGHCHTHDETAIHGHTHEHRGLSEVLEIIHGADLSVRAKKTAESIFTVLARAEARAHGVPIEQVHFHEVGAVDSIVDIVAAAVCLDSLDVTEVIVPYLCEGRGTVRCQHGILPVPVPAVAGIVAESGIPLQITETKGELVTPTGAAIAAAIRTSDKLPEHFCIEKIGIGAGKRAYERPSFLRAMLISSGKDNDTEADFIYKLETNVDDCTGEALGHVMEKLFAAGAREVNFSPVFMKKNRPAYQLNVICTPQKVEELEKIIFLETTTIGIRRTAMERTVLEREQESFHTRYGLLEVKKCILPDGTIRRYPEYDSVARLAGENQISFQNMMELIKQQLPTLE